MQGFPSMETDSVFMLGFLSVVPNHVFQGKGSMKKLFSLALFLLPSLGFCESSVITTKNTFSFSTSISTLAAANPAWQVFNGPENRKTIYIEHIGMGGDTPMLCTFFSTNVGTGFTGTQTRATATPMDIGKGTSISSCTFTTSATSPTGDTVWQRVVLASTTFTGDLSIAIRPGKALYIVGTKPAAGKVFVNFYWREEYAP